MDILKAFRSAFERMDEKGWDTIYVLVDLHGTIFKPCYDGEEKYEFYPYAKETLQRMSNMPNIKVILWTCTDKKYIPDYIKVLADNGINISYVNCNPEVISRDEYNDPKQQSFDEKLYYNVGIDDKFGFDPDTDWITLYRYFLYSYLLIKREFRLFF